MISYASIGIDDIFTEGFEASFPSAMSFAVTAGTFNKVSESGIATRNFPAFEFDLEADPELTVVYDVYLLRVEGEAFPVHVDRTVLGYDTLAIYDGTEEVLHCLSSIVLPPNTTSLQGVDISIRNLVQQEEASTDEDSTE